MNQKGEFPIEQAAERVTNIEGWVCRTCRTFYGIDERSARWCCAKDLPCGTEGCRNRVEKPYVACPSCIKARTEARWRALPEVPWDGETPLVLDDDDRFFSSADDLVEYLEEHDLAVEDVRLVICAPEEKPKFYMDSVLAGYFPDDMDCDGDASKIEAHVNAWIEKNVQTVWVPGGKRPTPDSLPVVRQE